VISYAQNLEDVILNRIFQNKRRGFYIDVGAHDPTDLSVTRHFYELGWRGINVEPIPESFEKFLVARPRDINLNIALGSRHDFLYLIQVVGRPDLSTLSEEVANISSTLLNASTTRSTVEVRTLKDVCKTHCFGQSIDFIKIDVEGYEKEVIAGGDWSSFRPTAVLIEASVPTRAIIKDWDDPDKYASWRDWEHMLLEANYVCAYYDGLNRLYVRGEDAHLVRRYHIPITVLQDGFSLYSDVRQVQEAESELARARQQLAEAGQTIKTLQQQALDSEQRLRSRIAELESHEQQLGQIVDSLRAVVLETQRSGGALSQHMRRLRSRTRPDLRRVSEDAASLAPAPGSGGLDASAQSEASPNSEDERQSRSSSIEMNGERPARVSHTHEAATDRAPILPHTAVHWRFDAFSGNARPAIFQQGWRNTHVHALQLLPKSRYRKVWIRQPSPELAAAEAAQQEAWKAQHAFLELALSEVEELTEQGLSGAQLEEILCSNIGFAHYTDHPHTPEFLLACIAHHTPILVNPLPLVRDVLGDAYPLYYYSYVEAVELAQDLRRLCSANSYLRGLAARMADLRAPAHLGVGLELVPAR